MAKTIKISMERYAYPRVSGMFEVPAHVVGALAVNRDWFWGEGDAPDFTGRKPDGWTVTHIASGKTVASVHCGRCIGAKRAELMQWAKRWQEECPEWFAALETVADWSDPEAIKSIDAELTRDAIDKGRALSRALSPEPASYERSMNA